MVNSAVEAAQAVESAYYPPIGKRSKGSPAAVFYGNDYYSKINDALRLIIMIETMEAVEKAEEILQVPGVNGCLIGAGDLSFIMRETNRASYFDASVERVLSIGRAKGIAMGISVNSPEEMMRWWGKGAQFFLASHDMAIIHSGIRSHYAKYTTIKTTGIV
jgi:2-keto-3-deoxy-L-rhamnonate aldolase RhmA